MARLYLASLLLLASTTMAESTDESTRDKVIRAHGIMMAVAFTILFPLGATLMRALSFRGLVWFHAGWQAVTYLLALAAFGMGVWFTTGEPDTPNWYPKLTIAQKLTYKNGHPIIGIVVIGALIFQPLLGLLQHSHYRKTSSTSVWGKSHRWVGRILLVLGVINGGLGLQMAEEEDTYVIVYSALAGFFFLLWFAVVIFTKYVVRPESQMRGKTASDSEESAHSTKY